MPSTAVRTQFSAPVFARTSRVLRHRRRFPVRPLTLQAKQRGAAEDSEGDDSKPFSFGGLSKLVKNLGTQRAKRLKVGGGQPAEGTGVAGLLGTFRIGGTRIRRDPNTVFVAGATGRLGARIVRELLAQGLRVRAGARNVEQARNFVATAATYGLLSPDAVRRLEVVSVDLEKQETIAPAIGNAGKVVSAIGAAETALFDVSGPKRIDGEAATRLVNTAAELGVEQFTMVTSLGTGKFGWPAAALNLFWGVLTWKRKAEVALENSGMQYVVVRPGGMERPDDSYKRTHNVRLAKRDSLFGGQVSRLQVAELVAAAVANPDVAENKVLEVVAETSAPLLGYEALLQQQPVEVSQEARREAQRAAEEAQERLAEAQEQADAAAAAREEAQAQGAELAEAIREAKQQEAAARAEVAGALKEADSIERALAQLRESAEQARRKEAAAKAVLAAAAQVAKELRSLSRQEIAAIEKPILFPPTEQELAAQREAEEKAKRAEEAKAQKEAEAKAQREAAERAKAEAAEKAKAEQGKREQEEQAKVEAAEKAKAEAAAKAKAEQAKREAEAKAKEEAAAKAQQAKREQEERVKAEKEAKAKAEAAAQQKQEAEAKAKREAEAKAKQAEREKAEKAEKAKAEAAAKAKQDKQEVEAKAKAMAKAPSAATKAAEEQAKENAREARQWIDKWRSGKAQIVGSNGSGSEAAGSDGAGGPFKGFKFPWQQQAQEEQDNGTGFKAAAEKPKAKAAEKPAGKPKAAGNVSPNVQEAREWIRKWRATTLETKLPKNVEARQQ
ncbi:hypothetical protein WJX72_002337 [[Myrmecia] bisecta]|uniref:NAD(P)-binding domain-containing protein n=1 Tax=[Myrmecia] bisecta TaxID=41462 RepID=A0AAW1QBL1_9CHLO